MATAVKQHRMFIGGEWVEGEGEETLPVVNPATAEVIAEIPRGTEGDVDRAVKAARKAFDEIWFDSTPSERQDMARTALAQIGLPAVIRPAFTLGGSGGGIVATDGDPVIGGTYRMAS